MNKIKTKEDILNGIFTHTEINMPNDCVLKISPSMINRFFEYPVNWYKEVVLNEPAEFKGNTATVLGSMCHAVYESVICGVPIAKEEFDNVLLKYCEQRIDIDYTEIVNNYADIAEKVINEILLRDKLFPQYSEIALIGKIINGVYIGGHCDYISRGIITDFKTVSKKPDEISIPFHYKIQLMAYRYAAQLNNIHVEPYIQIIYGVKAQKTIPARCYMVREEVSYIDEQKALETFKLIGESVLKCKEDSSLIHLIFKSYQFKKEIE